MSSSIVRVVQKAALGLEGINTWSLISRDILPVRQRSLFFQSVRDYCNHVQATVDFLAGGLNHRDNVLLQLVRLYFVMSAICSSIVTICLGSTL